MHAKLRITLTAAALVAAVPAAGIASANEGMRGPGKGQGGGGQGHGGKPGKRCDRPRGFQARGALAEGSTLTQVEGADTARRFDDRFSGTVVVQLRQRGGRRSREEQSTTPSAPTSFTVDHVRALGTISGEDATSPLPAVGTRVRLVGWIAKAGCTAATPTPTPSPSPEPDADADDTADRATSDDDAQDAPDASAASSDAADDAGDDYPDSDEPGATPTPSPTPSPAPAASSAPTIKLVIFKSGTRSRR